MFAEKVLKRFCELLDLEFQDSMVNWTSIPEEQRDQFAELGGAFKEARETSGFFSSTVQPRVEQEGYDDAIAAMVQMHTPIYQRFRELAIKV